MPYRDKSADELASLIYDLVDRLVRDGPEASRHDRANLGNEIVLCASLLCSRLQQAEQAERERATATEPARKSSSVPETPIAAEQES